MCPDFRVNEKKKKKQINPKKYNIRRLCKRKRRRKKNEMKVDRIVGLRLELPFIALFQLISARQQSPLLQQSCSALSVYRSHTLWSKCEYICTRWPDFCLCCHTCYLIRFVRSLAHSFARSLDCVQAISKWISTFCWVHVCCVLVRLSSKHFNTSCANRRNERLGG